MTVEQLIEQLMKLDPKRNIVAYGGNEYFDLDEVLDDTPDGDIVLYLNN